MRKDMGSEILLLIAKFILHKTTGEQSNNVELTKMSSVVVLDGEKSWLIDEW